MRIKSILYLLLLIALLIGITFGISYKQNYKLTSKNDHLIEILETLEPKKDFKLYFFVPHKEAVNTGSLFVVNEKTTDNKFKLKVKPNYTYEIPRKYAVDIPIYKLQHVKFDEIITVPLAIIMELLKGKNIYALQLNEDDYDKYRDLLSERKKWEFLQNIFGNDFGIGNILQTILLVFILLLGFQFLVNKVQKLTNRDFSFILTLIGITIGYRIINGFHYGVSWYSIRTFFDSFGIIFLLLEISVYSIPVFIYRYTIRRSHLKLDFLDTEFLKCILLFVIVTVLTLLVNQILDNFIYNDSDTLYVSYC